MDVGEGFLAALMEVGTFWTPLSKIAYFLVKSGEAGVPCTYFLTNTPDFFGSVQLVLGEFALLCECYYVKCRSLGNRVFRGP